MNPLCWLKNWSNKSNHTRNLQMHVCDCVRQGRGHVMCEGTDGRT